MVKLSVGLLGQICVSSCNKVATVRTLVDRVLWRVNGWELVTCGFSTRESIRLGLFVSLVNFVVLCYSPQREMGLWQIKSWGSYIIGKKLLYWRAVFSDLSDLLACQQQQVTGVPGVFPDEWLLGGSLTGHTYKEVISLPSMGRQVGKSLKVHQFVCIPLNLALLLFLWHWVKFEQPTCDIN